MPAIDLPPDLSLDRHQTLVAGIGVVAISCFFVLQNTPDRTVRAYVGVLALYPSLFLFPLVSIGFGLVVVSAISPKSFLYNLHSRSLGLVATLSYSLYLSHKIVFHLVQNWFGRLGVPADGPVMMFLCLVSAVGFALLMHHAIERPAFRLGTIGSTGGSLVKIHCESHPGNPPSFLILIAERCPWSRPD